MNHPENQHREGELASPDFTEFLSRRLNLRHKDAVAVLGKCLVEYQAERQYEIVVGPVSDAA